MSDRTFWARRIHSLMGVIPIGAFLFEHMLTNSKAIHGAKAYNDAVLWILSLPYVIWMEVLFIGIPIAFHAIYGVYIAFQARLNAVQYPYLRNWMHALQRISGAFLLVYIVWHVWGTRVQKIYDPTLGDHFFEYMVDKFHNPYFLAFQILGTLAATFHFANGLWTFLIVWGIAVGPKSQKLAAYVCYAVGAVLLIFGIDAFRGFLTAGGS